MIGIRIMTALRMAGSRRDDGRMDDLTAFLKARLDEDEAAANEIHRPRDCGSVDRDGEFSPDPIWCSCDRPARALREVEAGRRILARYEDVRRHGAPGNQGPDEYELWLLPSLAAVYSDHPGYRQEWEP